MDRIWKYGHGGKTFYTEIILGTKALSTIHAMYSQGEVNQLHSGSI